MRLTVWCDRLVLGGLVLLIVLTPLAFGSVHLVARSIVAIAVLVLGLVALAKVAIAGPPADGWRQLPRAIWLPLAAFLVLGVLQLTPLAPSFLGLISPTAFGVYERSLPGWPEVAPYGDLGPVAVAGGTDSRWRLLQTPEEKGRTPTDALPHADTASDPRGRDDGFGTASGISMRRSLSLAPSATRASLILVTAYVVAFLLVVLYPWNASVAGEHRAERVLVRALLVAVVGVAAIGILQRFTWNGRILWFFVPFDWHGVPDSRPRTCGPFVNRNHFAGYIALLFPMLLSGALAATGRDARRRGRARRLSLAGAAFVVGLASLLSLSRGGWIALAIGTAALLALGRAAGPEMGARVRAPRRRLGLGAALVVVTCVALLPPVAAGLRSGGRDVDARLRQTLGDAASWDTRVRMWRGTLSLVRDAPVVGVGLGAWGDLYPRYDSGPYDGIAPRAAHNDYLQLLAELGVLGFGLVAIPLATAVRRVWAGAGRRSRQGRALAVGVLAGLAGLAVHELVEFNLQIPAIALSGAIMLGTVLRPTLPRAPGRAARRARGCAILGVLVLGGFIVLAPRTAPPSWSGPPRTVEAALARIDTFPARARHHYELAALLSTDAAAGPRRREIEIARWLAPRDPRFGDALAAMLAEAGHHTDALREIERSMEVAPRREDHPYLSDRLLGWLSTEEIRAIERGLERAIAHHNPVAPWTLAAVHRGRARPLAAAAVLEHATDRATASAERYALFLAAGIDRVQGEDAEGAARSLHAASRLRPAATAPYVWLLSSLAATDDGLAKAYALAEEGVRRGADPAELWFAVAAVAKRTGRPDEQQAALERAIDYRPALAKAHFELGLLLLGEGHAHRAVLSLRRATERAPASVAYWYHLARATHASHDAVGARRALERALELRPDHSDSLALLASIRPARP